MPPGMRRLGGGRVELTNAAGATMVTTEDAVPPELFSLPEPPPQAPLVPEGALAFRDEEGRTPASRRTVADAPAVADLPRVQTTTATATQAQVADPAPAAPVQVPVPFDSSRAPAQAPPNAQIRQVTVAGGPRRTVRQGYSVTSTPDVEVDPKFMEAVLTGNEEAAQAAERRGDVESARDKELAGNLDQLRGRIGGMEEDRRSREDRMLQEANNMRAGFMRDLQNATSAVIDPDRRDTGQRVLSGIAAFLDGLAGSTAVLDHIQQSLQNDIASQQQQIASGEFRVRGNQTAYQMAREQTGDERASAQLAMAFELDAAAREAERIGLQASSDVVRENAKMLASELRRGSLAQYIEMERMRMGQRQMSEQFREVGGGSRTFDEIVVDGQPVYRGRQGSLLNPTTAGASGIMLGAQYPGSAEHAQAQAESRPLPESVTRSAHTISQFAEAMVALQDVERLAERLGSFTGPGAGRLPGTSLVSANAEALRNAEARVRNAVSRTARTSGGTQTEGDIERAMAEMPSLVSASDSARTAAIERLMAMYNQKMDLEIQAAPDPRSRAVLQERANYFRQSLGDSSGR